MLGKDFRKLRKSQNISLIKVSQGIVSKSVLSRWERGEGTMPIETVIALLKRIHVQPQEYLDEGKIPQLKQFLFLVSELYQKDDMANLKSMIIKLLGEYHKDINNRINLYKAEMACNFYMDSLNINDVLKLDFFSDIEIYYLVSRLLLIENWTQEDVVLFSDTQLLLSATDVYVVSRSLISFITDMSNKSKTLHNIALEALLNSTLVLIKKKELHKAYVVFQQVKRQKFTEKQLNEKVRLKFFALLFDYLKNGNSEKMTKFLNNLKDVGLAQISESLTIAFSQIQEIYVGEW